MPKTKLDIIKPALGVTHITDGDLLSRLNAVHDGMLNNPANLSPPIDMPGFKAAIDAYTAAAALDGGKACGLQHETGNTHQQPRTWHHLHIPSTGIRETRLLRLERLSRTDVDLPTRSASPTGRSRE